MTKLGNSARLKVKRANSHLDQIIRDSTPLSKDLYNIVNGLDYSSAVVAKPDCFTLTYRPKVPISEHFRPIIGDTVNNLREAMDYWINKAVEIVTGTQHKLYFPFSTNLEELISSPNYKLLKKVFPQLADFIVRDIKPFRDTNISLYAAASLCNHNKHNDFVPIVIATSINNINCCFGSVSVRDMSIGGNADRAIRMIRSGTPITIEHDFETIVEMTFPGGAVLDGKEVIPTLLSMSETVSQALDALDTFVEPYMK